jgi:putative flippase GtrA
VTLHTLVFRYTFFAVLATLANLAAQRAVLWFGDSGTLFALAVGTGTGVGLVLKYFLDKRWIFEDLSSGVKEHGKKFSLYTAMGIFTTAIFWGTETGFWLVWQTDMMRELGAVIGLSIGYVVKYCLDRRFVFTGTRLGQST